MNFHVGEFASLSTIFVSGDGGVEGSLRADYVQGRRGGEGEVWRQKVGGTVERGGAAAAKQLSAGAVAGDGEPRGGIMPAAIGWRMVNNGSGDGDGGVGSWRWSRSSRWW